MLLFFILIMFFGGVLMRRFGNNDACPDDIDSSFRVSDRVQVIAAVVVLVLAFAAAVVFAGFAGHEKYECRHGITRCHVTMKQRSQGACHCSYHS